MLGEPLVFDPSPPERGARTRAAVGMLVAAMSAAWAVWRVAAGSRQRILQGSLAHSLTYLLRYFSIFVSSC